MANADISWKDRRDTMTSDPRYRALFLGAGPQMACGVGQFTRLLGETVEKIEPGQSTDSDFLERILPSAKRISVAEGEIKTVDLRLTPGR